MSKVKTKPFDPAEYLDDSESIAAYMSYALEGEDPAFVADALGVVARAESLNSTEDRRWPKRTAGPSTAFGAQARQTSLRMTNRCLCRYQALIYTDKKRLSILQTPEGSRDAALFSGLDEADSGGEGSA
ncbi:MAG: hypothetical protein WAM66_14010 [Acidobacteriaceae bacterium]